MPRCVPWQQRLFGKQTPNNQINITYQIKIEAEIETKIEAENKIKMSVGFETNTWMRLNKVVPPHNSLTLAL